MDLELKGKIAPVTRTSSGIDAAAAQVLAEKGVNGIVACRQDRAGVERIAPSVAPLKSYAWLYPMNINGDGALR